MARSYVADMKPPAVNDSVMLISMKLLQTMNASSLRMLQATLGWAAVGRGMRQAGEGRSQGIAMDVLGSDRQESRSHPASCSQTPSECLVFASEFYSSYIQVVIRQ